MTQPLQAKHKPQEYADVIGKLCTEDCVRIGGKNYRTSPSHQQRSKIDRSLLPTRKTKTMKKKFSEQGSKTIESRGWIAAQSPGVSCCLRFGLGVL